MRRDTYLNIILTVNAILLATMLWVQIADQPLLAGNASAQRQSKQFVFPNDADQRQKLIEEMKKMSKSMEATRKLIESGKLRVEVTNLGEIKMNR
ncbi:MAG: hypothetical protein IH891_00105 [Planctomycetes bacterium]|nr:hypothetical protein [Planctomycetota bacterium]